MKTVRFVAGCLAGLFVATCSAQQLTPSEAAIAKAVDASAAADVALLEQIVNINSGTMNLDGVVQVKDVLEPQFQALGFKTRWVPMRDAVGRAGDLVAEHACPQGAGHCGKRMLLIGHMDTVFEPSSPFQKYEIVPGTNGRVATGPGTSDMKGGLVVMLSALRAMQAAGTLANAEITVVLSGDEEGFGRPSSISRHDMIAAAKHSDLALEFENATRLGGVDGRDSVRLGRRSSISWRMEVTARSGHSSQIFSDSMGDGAVYELARILDTFRRELMEPGLTYNVGLVSGGAAVNEDTKAASATAVGKVNIVPAIAVARGDIRTLSEEQTVRVEKKMEAIVRDHLPRTTARIEFAEGYPAMAVTPASEALLEKLQKVNESLGLSREEVQRPEEGGAGDIAFVAPFIPGLVGVGVMGAGAHAPGETVYLDSIPVQAKRMALLMTRLAEER